MEFQQKINLSDILSFLSCHEGNELEFKSAKGGIPKSLWETYSAMANTCGGIILLGVEDNRSVSGVKDIGILTKNFWDTINNAGKVSINLLNNDDVQKISHSDGFILAIRIPRAKYNQRPVYIDRNPIRGTYRRNSEGDYHCTEQEVRRMFADCSEQPFDSRILEHITLEDLDSLSIKQYRQRLASNKPTHPWLSEDDQGLLTKLGGWKFCRSTGIKGVTVSGLLMFGLEESLREALPQYHIDFREKLSSDLEIRWTDRLTLDGTWSGNLFQFYLRVIQKLRADLKLPFQLDNEMYCKGESIVHVAIREVLVNALIHADYQGQGGIVIEKYHDRFEFSNPGLLLISFEQLLNGNISECRNKSLQTMFAMIGAAEKAGSGVDKIKKGWESQHWRSPAIREQVIPDRVLWMLPMISLIPEESLDRLKSMFGDRFASFNPLEVQALVTADIEGYVDNIRMRQITGKHATDITKLLQNLVSNGALSQDRQGRWTRYSIAKELVCLYKDVDSVHKKINNSVHNPQKSMEISSLSSSSDSVHSDNYSIHKKAQISESDLSILVEKAKLARKNKRLPPKKMEQIILNLCRGRWLNRKLLAELLKRNSDGLRSRFLTPMVGHGLLCLRYPDKPNRTDQAYTVTK